MKLVLALVLGLFVTATLADTVTGNWKTEPRSFVATGSNSDYGVEGGGGE